MMQFDSPARLVVIPLVLLGLLLARRLWRQRNVTPIPLPDAELFMELPVTTRERLQQMPLALRVIALLLAAVGLAGPFAVREQTVERQVGLDVLIVLDVSQSMAAEDFEPSRLGSAQRAAERIVAARPQDRFGVISFADDVQMNSPLTLDHAAVVSSLRQLAATGRSGGTALGDAIAHGVNALRATTSSRRVLLVFSDGGDNGGDFNPVNAATLAARFGIRIYTAAIGSEDPAPFTTELGQVLVRVPFDTSLLSKVAAAGNGRMFSITNDMVLGLSDELARLEPLRSVPEQELATINLAYLFAALAALCACTDIALSATVLSRVS